MKEAKSPQGPDARRDRKGKAGLRFVAREVGNVGEVPPSPDDAAIQEQFEGLTPRERADALYAKVMAHVAVTRDKETPGQADLDLIREIKLLLADPATRDIAIQVFGEARMDQEQAKQSELVKEWTKLEKDIAETQKSHEELVRSIFLQAIKSPAALSVAKTKAERQARKLIGLRERHDALLTLDDNSIEHVAENTDAAAMFQFEQLSEYQRQLDEEGFAWLPSRLKIHAETVAMLQNGRVPVLVGEAGTGKSEQANAAAMELTGSLPTEVACSATTNERDLISDKAIDVDGKSYEEYGPFMQAFTGFSDSRQTVPDVDHGRLVRLDEAGMLGTRPYAAIKTACQKIKDKSVYFGRKVLPGAGMIWTTNPVGARYADRKAVDPAMRRELGEIQVDYPDQSADSPELYEFMLSSLLDENQHVGIAEQELKPAYQKVYLVKEDQMTLTDGRRAVAQDELIEDKADKRHGTLWRLANAVKDLQDSFVYGNRVPDDAVPEEALRYSEVDGEIVIDDNGQLLTLSSSVITLGEVKSWMRGFANRRQKSDSKYQVETFSEWVRLKAEIYLGQTDAADRDKVRAIFEHYHLFDNPPDIKDAKPMTPKQIGYLSPRVPRPLHTVAPVEAKPVASPDPEPIPPAPILYVDRAVSLMSGETILMREGGREFATIVTPDLKIETGQMIEVDKVKYKFAGTELDGADGVERPVFESVAEPGLYEVITAEQMELQLVAYQVSRLERDVTSICEMTAETAA